MMVALVLLVLLLLLRRAYQRQCGDDNGTNAWTFLLRLWEFDTDCWPSGLNHIIILKVS
jgi:hypothetical protein